MSDDPNLPAKPQPSTAEVIAEMLPGLVRVARASAARTVQWAIDANREAARTVLDDIAKGESPVNVVADATAVWAKAIGRGTSEEPKPRPEGQAADELREMGTQLLRDSANVWYEQDVHPAFRRVLQELLPDEARILRFLYKNGPQPSVDVRTNRPFDRGSEKIASGLSMVGLYAGVRNQEDTSVELANLERLRLIWFSKEQVADPSVYQLLEAQPDVLEAMKRAGRSPRTEHRSIELTPFGERFCETCLPLD
jgi:hypothetical protein